MDAAPKSTGFGQARYVDYSHVSVDATFEDIRRINPRARAPSGESGSKDGVRRRGPSQKFVFPTKLFEILTKPELSHIITWMKHGRSWRVVDRQAFTEHIMPKYFAQTKYPSFIRQVNGWGFKRITQGEDQNSYYNEFFLRNMRHLVKFMTRHPAVRQVNEPEPILRSYSPLLLPPPNVPPHVDGPARQTGERNGSDLGHAGHEMPSNNQCAQTYDGQEVTQYVQSANTGPTETGSTTSSRHSFHPQAAYHHPHLQGYSHSSPSHQGNQHSCNPAGHQRSGHEHTDFENGIRSTSSRSSSRSTSPSVPDPSHSTNAHEATCDYHLNSAPQYNQGGHFHHGYNVNVGYPRQVSSDVAAHHISGATANVSQEYHQGVQMGLGEHLHGSYDLPINSNRGSVGRSTAHWPAQYGQAHAYNAYGTYATHSAQPREQLSLQAPTSLLSAGASKGNGQIEEQQATESSPFHDHSKFEPMSWAQSSIVEDWDDVLVAKLSCQLEQGS